MRICFVASEVAPLAKTGGLADVAGALPRHLHEQRHDIRVFMPFYSSIGTAALQTVPVDGAQNVELRLGAHLYRYSLLATQLPGSSVPRRSASSMIAIARRSFTEDSGLKNSHFTYIVVPAGASRLILTIGVRPMVPKMLS